MYAYKLECFNAQYFPRIYFIAKINTKEYKAQSSERFQKLFSLERMPDLKRKSSFELEKWVGNVYVT